MTTKNFFKIILRNFFSRIYFFDKSKSKIEEIKDLLNLCKMSFDDKDIHFLENHNIDSKNIRLINDYIILHFDEKWIFNQYIQKYISIQPNMDELNLFIEKLVNKTNYNLIITTGTKQNNIIDEFVLNFQKINKNLYEKKINNKIIQVYVNIDFFDLKYLIKNSKYLITCHGASTHLASAYNIEIYDIFELSQIKFYEKWNSHIKNYKYFYREDFNHLTQKILNKL